MTDSAPSNLETATSGNPAPAPPVLPGPPTFDGLVATLQVNLPAVDINGVVLPVPLTAIKVFVAPTGQLAGNEGNITPTIITGSFPAGSQQSVQVTVPAYATAYDFDAECSI